MNVSKKSPIFAHVIGFEYEIKHKYTMKSKTLCIDSIMLRRLAGRQSKAACTGRRQHDTPAAD